MKPLLRKLILPLMLLASTLGFTQTYASNPGAQSVTKGVDPSTLNVTLHIPIISKAGTVPFSTELVFQNNFWHILDLQESYYWVPTARDVNNSQNFGWLSENGLQFGLWDEQGPGEINTCLENSDHTFNTEFFGFIDANGVDHPFKSAPTESGIMIGTGTNNIVGCRPYATYDVTLQDGSGLTAHLSATAVSTITTASGATLIPQQPSIQGVSIVPTTPSLVDLNFNSITEATMGTIIDSVGVNELSLSGAQTNGCPIGHSSFTYPTSTGNAAVTISCSLHLIQTNFSCGIIEYGKAFDVSKALVDSINLGNGSSYQFTYESQVPGYLTGRLASIQYPDGSTQSYTYSGFCPDSTASIAVTDPLGTTTYTKSALSAGTYTTTVVSPSPALNNTVYTFIQQINTEPGQVFVSQIKRYQGSSTLLSTTTYCYQGVGTESTCPTAAAPTILPITQQDAYTRMAGMSSSSRVTTKWDSFGNITETDTYDFGATNPAFKTVNSSFGKSWNGSSCVSIGNNVNDVPCTSESYDINGNPIKYSKFTYNSYGKPTSVSTWVSGSISSGQYLTTSYSYTTKGMLYQSTDPNGKVATNTYDDCNGSGLTKSVSPITSIYTQFTHDSGCNGFVQTSMTTPDGQTTYSSFTDPLWRISSKTDQENNVINFSYPTSAPFNWSESTLTFGTTTLDSYTQSNPTANPPSVYSQKQDTPNSGWDSVTSSSSWGSTGVTSSASLPCVTSTKGVACTSAVTTTTHDALGRSLVKTDGGGGTITYSYIMGANVFDVLATLGPAPAGESVKQVQKEYNGLGQLLSTCALGATGGVSCGQVNGGTGVLTTYTHNPDGTLQRAVRGSQTHSFTYDIAGRTLTAVTPEGGTKQLFYDSAPSTPGVSCSTIAGLQSVPNTASVPLGHLLKTYDSNGTTTC